MQRLIFVLALVAAVALGYWAGHRSVAKSSAGSTTEPRTSVSAVNSSGGLQKLQGLTETDIADYYRLKTLEERYKKADEILGKIMLILLVDLGIRAPGDVAKVIENPTAPKELAISSDESSKKPSASPVARSTPPQTATLATPSPSLQTHLDEIRSENDIKEFLKSAQVENFEETFKSSRGFVNNPALLEEMNGRFVGTADVAPSGKRRRWGAEMVLKGRIEKGKLTGEYTVLISENGKIFSNQRGKGTLDANIRELPSDSRGVFIEVAPDTYLQAYYIKRLDAVIGNFIERKNLGEPFRTLGTVHMVRE